MGWNGSGTVTRSNGTHSGATTWQQDAAAGTDIEANIHDLHDEDIRLAIQNALAKDGQNSPTADINFGGYGILNHASGSARTSVPNVGKIQDCGILWGGTSAGSSNAYTISLTPAITAYANGQQFAFKADKTNSGAATLNVNAVGAVAIRKTDGVADVEAGDILNGQIVHVTYDPGGFFTIRNRGALDILRATGLTYTGSIFSLLASTSDASDTSEIRCRAAGAFANGRGAGWVAYGADHATNAGELHLFGDGGKLFLETVGHDVYVQPGGNLRWSFQTVGDLANDATNGGNIVFNRDSTGVLNSVTSSLAAAGSSQGDAAAITRIVTKITSPSPTAGVRLPASIPVGLEFTVVNPSATKTKLYPASGENINALSTNAAIDIGGTAEGDNLAFKLLKITSTNWLVTAAVTQGV